MKVNKLVSKNQPAGWFERITSECRREYPIHLIDIDINEKVIDLGCNVGGFSEAYKSRFNNILAIDASSYNVEQYKSRHDNEILHKAAFSIDGEIVKLKKYIVGDNDTNSGNFSITGYVNETTNEGWKGDEYEEVETISLENIINMVGEIGLLKIDIEGAEFDFLYEKDLSGIKYITGEFHNFLGKEKHELLFNWIGKTHTEIYTEGDGNRTHFLKTWKKS